MNKTINQDLQLKTNKKYNVHHDVSHMHRLSHNHRLLSMHVARGKMFCRTQYKNYLAGDKWKYIVTLGEA